MKSVNENYFKSSFETFQKSLPFREIYLKYIEKNNIQVYFIMAIRKGKTVISFRFLWLWFYSYIT